MPELPPNSSRSSRRMAGLVLLILAPLCIAAAVAYSLFAPRLFSAFTEFQLSNAQGDAPGVPAAYQSARAKYATVMQDEPLAEKVRIETLDAPGKFRITATDRQPLRAMHSANGLTLMISDALRQEDDELPLPMVILAKAEMPKTPSRPNVTLIMNVGISSAILCAVAGVALRRASRRPPAFTSADHPSTGGAPARSGSTTGYDY